MKDLQRGFIVPVLLVIIAALVVGGGFYIFKNKKAQTPFITNIETPTTSQDQQTNTQPSPASQQAPQTNTQPLQKQSNSDNQVSIQTKSITPSYENKEIYIFVDDATYGSLNVKIQRLADDIKSDLGSRVIVQHANYSSPVEIRNTLKRSYAQGELLGSILIGNIPTFSRNDGFYTDWFYSALNDTCPISPSGIFNDSLECNTLDSFTNRKVFTGRITPPVSGQPGITMVEKYLDKNHAFRLGQINFPKKLLLYPSVNILDENNGKAFTKNSLLENITSSLLSQSRYSQSEVDMILETDYLKQKNDYISKLKNNRYEAAVVNVHGSTDGQFPSQKYDSSRITSDEIMTASPDIFYVALLTCSNGGFKSPNYIAGEFLFNGDTLLVTANTTETLYGGFLQDPPIEPIFFQPLSFLNSQSPIGNLFIHDDSLFSTQIFGDPTLRLRGNVQNSSRLEVSSETIDFGKVKSDDNKSIDLKIKNAGQNLASVLMLPTRGLRINDKPLSDFFSVGGTLHPRPGKNYSGFVSDRTANGFFKKISIPAGETVTIRFSFSPFAQKTDTVVNGKYFDVQTLLTSDITRPYLDINLKAESID